MSLGAYRTQCIATRNSGVAEDVAVIDMSWYHADGYTPASFAALGEISNILSGVSAADAGEIDALQDALTDFLTAVAGLQASVLTWDRIKLYDAGGGLPTPNPPIDIRDVNIAGGQPTSAPPQVAHNCTYRTASRRHWGRFYLPQIAAGNVASSGRAANALVDNLITFMQGLLDTARVDGWYPVVFVTGGANGLAHTVREIAADDILDVQRRRRYDLALRRATHTIV